MWPWSFTKCNRDIQKQQQISGCNSVNHYDLYEHQGVDFRTGSVKYSFLIGRGAPEIDILEAMPGKGYVSHTSFTMPYLSTSLQVKQFLFNKFFKVFPSRYLPEFRGIVQVKVIGLTKRDIRYGKHNSLTYIHRYQRHLVGTRRVFTTVLIVPSIFSSME